MRAYLEQSSIPEILEEQPSARDRFLMCDVEGLLELARECQLRESEKDLLLHGLPELTAKCEKYMHEFEDEVFVGRGWNVVDDVAGSVANVPAYLAGNPYSMRRRQRASTHTAPLVVFFELTGSSGSMETRPRRGAAMMALVRLLSNQRPTEFWTLTTYGVRNAMNMLACRMDTTPLDTARTAAMLADLETLMAVSEINRKMIGGGCWSYGDQCLERTWSGEALKRIVAPGADILFIPASWYGDLHADPVKWIRDMLEKYGMSSVVRE